MTTYMCNCCHQEYELKPSSVGFMGNSSIYCPECSKKLHSIEVGIWNEFIKKYSDIPSRTHESWLKRIVWTPSHKSITQLEVTQ